MPKLEIKSVDGNITYVYVDGIQVKDISSISFHQSGCEVGVIDIRVKHYPTDFTYNGCKVNIICEEPIKDIPTINAEMQRELANRQLNKLEDVIRWIKDFIKK